MNTLENIDPFDMMQRSVDAIQNSPHPTNKIASTIAGINSLGEIFAVTATNYYPHVLIERLGPNVRIGDASNSVHAETENIFNTHKTEGAHLYCTDLCCPNCAKNIVLAGISDVYFDHKGFLKDFAQRREQAFYSLSMRFFKNAGIGVHKVWRKEKRLETLSTSNSQRLKENSFFTAQPVDTISSNTCEHTSDERPFATCLAKDNDGNVFKLKSWEQPLPGLTQEEAGKLLRGDKKYSPYIQPLNALLIAARREGLEIIPESFHSSRVPTSRELVNFVGAGFGKLSIGEVENARDQASLEGYKQLLANNIIS